MESERVILKRLREINGLTIRQAAEQVGRSIGWLSEIETGSRKCALKVRDREKLMQLYKADKYKRQFGSWLTNAQKETNKQKAPSLDGAIYKYLRTEKAKMTLKKVALRLGVSLGYLSKIESNQRTPKKEMKEKMLKLYGYSVNSFRNFTTANKRANNIPKRYKLNIVLNSLSDDLVAKVFEFAYELQAINLK